VYLARPSGFSQPSTLGKPKPLVGGGGSALRGLVSLRCLVSTMAPINAVAAAAVTAARASVNLDSGRGLDRAIRLLDCSTVRPVLVLGGRTN